MKDIFGEVTKSIVNDEEMLAELNTALAFPAWVIEDRTACAEILDILEDNDISNVCITYVTYCGLCAGRAIMIVNDFGKACDVCAHYIGKGMIEFVGTKRLFGFDN